MLATEVLKTPTIKSVVNVLPQAASSHSTDWALAASLDLNEEEEEESFHKFHHHRMMWCSPISWRVDSMWQITKWLQTCEEGLDEEEISWWPLISPLTDGSAGLQKTLPGGLSPPGDGWGKCPRPLSAHLHQLSST